jgi:two-component system, OmpR family, response regulator RegX3
VTARVLVVDDEPALRDSVTYALEREGFDVSAVADGESALELAAKEPFDAVVLDVMLPGLPGTEVCRRLRRDSSVPIVMLTAKTAEVDRVVGLELGADDYVTKPFSLAELVARVRAILRRRELDRGETESPALVVGGLAIDRVRHEVRVDGRLVELTPSEFRLLALLASAPGRAFPRRELVKELWRSEYVGDERICDTHVVGLRRKVERNPAQPARILAVRGVGYKLVAA